jgi:hypothetical protein
MTIKNDLKDIGYLLITPFADKYRFEGVNYKRAATQVTYGGLALQVGLITAIFCGPVIIDKLGDVKENVKKKLKK